MGTYLSSPDRRRERENGINFWTSSMRGWRVSMEDQHIADPDFGEDMALYAVFDGHGGPKVSEFCQRNFGRVLKSQPAFVQGRYEAALEGAFLEVDRLLTQSPQNVFSFQSGCTTLVVLRVGRRLYVANAGDSRCLIFRSDGQILQMNIEHKPYLPEEFARISNAGGLVVNGRINENLNLSRAIGDLDYKRNETLPPEQQMISALPEVVVKDLEPEDEFMLLGCDGVYEVLTDVSLREVVYENMTQSNGDAALDEIFDRTLSAAQTSFSGKDNMSAILVKL